MRTILFSKHLLLPRLNVFIAAGALAACSAGGGGGGSSSRMNGGTGAGVSGNGSSSGGATQGEGSGGTDGSRQVDPGPDCTPANRPQTGPYNYAEALQKSIYFYDAQQAGTLPASNRVRWRGAAAMQDGADVGKDFTGGWFDAGDHVKFNITMAHAASFLAWGAVDYFEAYQDSCQLWFLLENLRHVNDYFIRTFTGTEPGNYELYTQIASVRNGDPNNDHTGPFTAAELREHVKVRESFKNNAALPASDVAGEEAAAMAASAILFHRTGEADYAASLLSTAKKLYDFGYRHRGSGRHQDPAGNVFELQYRDNYVQDLMWAAVWLHLAGEALGVAAGRNYVSEAGQLYESAEYQSQQSATWRTTGPASEILLARITGDEKYQTAVERHLDKWVSGSGSGLNQYDGLVYTFGWGTIRQATAQAWLALVYADLLGSGGKADGYRSFAERQIHYALGTNKFNRSFMVGFGNAGSAGFHATQFGPYASFEHFTNPTLRTERRHTLYGMLIGGPIEGNFSEIGPDELGDPKYYEGSLDYNAGLSGGLVRLYQEYGGAPLSDFPPVEEVGDEMFVEARVARSTSDSVRIEAHLNNRSAWPARRSDSMSFRYFIRLDSGDAADVQITEVESDCGAGAVKPALVQHSGDVYYVSVDCTGTPIMPAGRDAQRNPFWARKIVFAIGSNAAWNPDNDPSYSGTLEPRALHVTPSIPVYDAGELVFGTEP